MSLIGAHYARSERSWSTLRLHGLGAIALTAAFGVAILLAPEIINTRGWQPLDDKVDGYAIIGGALVGVALLGLIGLAGEDDDQHRWPRIVSVISAFLGVAWFITVAVTFTAAWVSGYPNTGPLFAGFGILAHATRFWLLSEFPRGA